MVKCLYKKYTIKKGMPYHERDLIAVMRSVGQLALHTLLSDNPLLQRSEVLRIAGDFVLDYGFLAGDKDFTDLTADMYVTYAHRSLEEFFGSFGFLQALDGKSVDDILGLDCENPIFMVNPLVLRFCLWLLTTKFFNILGSVYQKVVSFSAKRIDFRLLDIDAAEQVYPAISISDALLNTDSLKLKFFKDILEKCQYVRVLVIKTGEDEMCNYEHVDGVLGLMSSDLLSKLTCLSITGKHRIPSFHRDPLAITIDPTDPETLHKYLNVLLPKYNLLERKPQVHTEVVCRESHDLSTLTTKHIKRLHLVRRNTYSQVTLFNSSKFPHCPQLTHFTLQGCRLDESVLSSLMEAIQNRELPSLKRIELIDCTVSDCEWPAVPEFSFATREKLNLSQMQKLLSKLTDLTVYKPSDIDLAIPVRLENLTVLKLKDIDSHNLQQINYILKKGKLPNLTELDISGMGRDSVRLGKFLDGFDPHKTVKLVKLALQWFFISTDKLKILSEKLTAIRLTKLDLYYSSGFTGNLSVLFTHSFPTLNTLILRSCDLNANDLQSLVRANVEGKLPQLRHLDISFNVQISELFTHSAQWNQLTSLATTDEKVLNVDPEVLTSLEELILYTQQWHLPSVTRQWSRLKVIDVDDEDIAGCIADGVEQEMFPSLTALKCRLFDYEKPFFFKLLKANISVERI